MTTLLIIAPLLLLAIFVVAVSFIIYTALKSNTETISILLQDNNKLREDILFLVSHKSEVVLPSVAKQMDDMKQAEKRPASHIMELSDAIEQGLFNPGEENPRIVDSKNLTQ